MKKISILGTVGVPASYGGFETLAENLVRYADEKEVPAKLSVYCSGNAQGATSFRGASLRYIPINANGISSIPYDVVSLFSALWRKDDVILLLGVSGALALPIIRVFSKSKIVTNIDGVEWKREKWSPIAKLFLRLSELIAVKFSHQIIADNEGIADHVRQEYGNTSHVIAYGGDHAISVPEKPTELSLPQNFALALCRIEPENNIKMILEGFKKAPHLNLVFVGNWQNSTFAKELWKEYKGLPNIKLVMPIYDVETLKTIRSSAFAYVHGHSAGGTNPSLVEMMHFGVPILAYDCKYNRYTTDDEAVFFKSADQLAQQLNNLDKEKAASVGEKMRLIAEERYTWSKIGQNYFDLLLSC